MAARLPRDRAGSMGRLMLSTLGQSVRRTDPDRFFTALFAPPDRRETLLLLYAFNVELSRAREVASDPTIALIRLQWWREVVEGADRRHEIAEPLAAAIASGALHAGDLTAMIDGREAEADDRIADVAAWREYLAGTAGALAVAAGRLLGATGPMLAALRDLGASYGAAGVLRGIPVLGPPAALPAAGRPAGRPRPVAGGGDGGAGQLRAASGGG